MTFAARETSRSQGAPIALFLFKYGPGADDVCCYTSAEDPVTYAGNTYAPIAVSNANVVNSGTLDKASLELRMTKTASLVNLFAVWPPSTVIAMKIYEGHVGETEFVVRFSGRLIGLQTEVDEAVFTCEPISTALRRSGLRRNYQYGCPHVLYGPQCGASQAAATIAVTVQSVQSPYVVLPENWDTDELRPKYINGLASWTNSAGHQELRSIILLSSATEIELSGDASSLANGMTLYLAKGCSHQMADCSGIHNNINNFGGCPWIPFQNPIGVVNNYT